MRKVCTQGCSKITQQERKGTPKWHAHHRFAILLENKFWYKIGSASWCSRLQTWVRVQSSRRAISPLQFPCNPLHFSCRQCWRVKALGLTVNFFFKVRKFAKPIPFLSPPRRCWKFDILLRIELAVNEQNFRGNTSSTSRPRYILTGQLKSLSLCSAEVASWSFTKYTCRAEVINFFGREIA